MEENSDLVKARAQVEYWKNRIFEQENANEFYYTSGKEKEDRHQLEFWEDLVKRLEEEEQCS